MKLKLTILSLLFSVAVLANNPKRIIVLDQHGEPLTGVKITAEKQSETAYTDFDGVTVLRPVDRPVVYKVEYIGYKSGVLKVNPTNQEEVIKVVLEKK